jgi:hypothetical protein
MRKKTCPNLINYKMAYSLLPIVRIHVAIPESGKRLALTAADTFYMFLTDLSGIIEVPPAKIPESYDIRYSDLNYLDFCITNENTY